VSAASTQKALYPIIEVSKAIDTTIKFVPNFAFTTSSSPFEFKTTTIVDSVPTKPSTLVSHNDESVTKMATAFSFEKHQEPSVIQSPLLPPSFVSTTTTATTTATTTTSPIASLQKEDGPSDIKSPILSETKTEDQNATIQPMRKEAIVTDVSLPLDTSLSLASESNETEKSSLVSSYLPASTVFPVSSIPLSSEAMVPSSEDKLTRDMDELLSYKVCSLNDAATSSPPVSIQSEPTPIPPHSSFTGFSFEASSSTTTSAFDTSTFAPMTSSLTAPPASTTAFAFSGPTAFGMAAAPAQQPPVFGTSGFGAATPFTTPPMFGEPPKTAQTVFGAPSTFTSFNAPPAFGSSGFSAPAFGTTAQPAAAPKFGASSFGSLATSSSFGAMQQKTHTFGSFGTSSKPSFGQLGQDLPTTNDQSTMATPSFAFGSQTR
jgi:hypothetical protein